MPDLLSIASGAAQGFQQASQNLFNITVMKHKLKQDKEQWDLDSKIKNLQLKKAEFDLSPDQLALESEKLKAETASAKSKYNLDLITIKSKEREEREKATQFKTELGAVQKYFPDLLNQEGTTYAPRGSNVTGAIPELPEGIQLDFGNIKMGSSKTVNTQEQLRIEAKRIKDAGGTLSPQQEKLLYGYQKGISLEDLERGFGIEPKGGAEGGDMRSQAIQALKDEGIMVNEDTIAEAIKQLQAYEGD